MTSLRRRQDQKLDMWRHISKRRRTDTPTLDWQECDDQLQSRLAGDTDIGLDWIFGPDRNRAVNLVTRNCKGQ